MVLECLALKCWSDCCQPNEASAVKQPSMAFSGSCHVRRLVLIEQVTAEICLACCETEADVACLHNTAGRTTKYELQKCPQ